MFNSRSLAAAAAFAAIIPLGFADRSAHAAPPDSATAGAATGTDATGTAGDPGTAPVAAPAATSSIATVVVSARRLNAERSEIETQTGASTYRIDSSAIAAEPGGQNAQLNQVLLQAPDVVQDSFGQLHIRGDHNDLQFRLDGIILPEGISPFGQTLSPRLGKDVESSQFNFTAAQLAYLANNYIHLDHEEP